MDKGFWERFAGLYDLVTKTRGAAAERAASYVAVARMPGVAGRGRAHAD